jgi:hypothetical protein
LEHVVYLFVHELVLGVVSSCVATKKVVVLDSVVDLLVVFEEPEQVVKQQFEQVVQAVKQRFGEELVVVLV